MLKVLSLNGEEHVMSGLMPAILLIVTFLVLALLLRVVGRHASPAPTRDTEADNWTDER
jgi:hypothetical protein